VKKYKGINYSQRPEGYWKDKDVLSALLRNVKGRERRELIRAHWEQGRLDELEEELLADSLSDSRRVALGQIHPCFLGGEYLPDYQSREVEIARIHLRSVTADVLSIRARPDPEGIRYRVVDEHNETYRLRCEVSQEPLSLEELVCLIDEGGHRDLPGNLALGWNEYNLRETRERRTDYRYFTSLHSDLYPQLHDHYEHVFDDWVAEEEAEVAKAQAEKEEEEEWARLIAEEEGEGAGN
jgi:hypothetical protein